MAPVSDTGARDHGSEDAQLGPYTLGARIASGELTVVDEARLSSDQGSPIRALKRLHARYLDSEHCRRVFAATGTRMAAVSSEHLVRVVDAYDGAEPFVVMESVEGANLASLLRADRSAARTPFVLEAVAQSLEGLHALHELSGSDGEPEAFVHSAPVARHLLVGVDGVTRVADFTHMLGRETPWASWRDAHLDAAEMAPEQVLSPAHVDRRCDIFVAGIVLWEGLTGRALFRAETRSMAMSKMLRQPIVMPGELDARIPEGIGNVCLRALRRSRTERYPSAAEFAHALRSEAKRHALHASKEEMGAWVRETLQRSQGIRGAAPAAERSSGALDARAPVSPKRAQNAGTSAVRHPLHQTTLTFGWQSVSGSKQRLPLLPSAAERTRGAPHEGDLPFEVAVAGERETWSTATSSTVPPARLARLYAFVAIVAAALIAYLSLLASDDLTREQAAEAASARTKGVGSSQPTSLPHRPASPSPNGSEALDVSEEKPRVSHGVEASASAAGRMPGRVREQRERGARSNPRLRPAKQKVASAEQERDVIVGVSGQPLPEELSKSSGTAPEQEQSLEPGLPANPYQE